MRARNVKIIFNELMSKFLLQFEHFAFSLRADDVVGCRSELLVFVFNLQSH